MQIELSAWTWSSVQHRLSNALWYLAATLCCWSFGYTLMRGSDLWWHIATGRWTVAHKALPLTDPWSFTRAGQPWLQHEWLSDVIYQFWVSLFGLSALVYWKWLVLISTFLLLLNIVRRLAPQEPVASFLSVLLAIGVSAPFLDIRPHLYSILGYVVLLHLCLGRDRPPPRILPLLFVVWVNLHGGFFFGLLALFVLLLPVALAGGAGERKSVLLYWLACVLVCLCNPNVTKAFTYPLKYAFDSSSPFKKLDEWLPPFRAGGIQSPLYKYSIALFIIAAIYVLFMRSYRKQMGIPVVALILGFLTLAMSLTSRRFIPLFAVSQSLTIGPAFAHRLAPLLLQRVPKLLTPLLATGLGIVWLAPYPLRPYAFHYLTAEDNFPVDTCNFIETNHLSGNVFAYYNWGGYLHLRTDGRMKVYIDGRADTVYDDLTFLRYVSVEAFRPDWIRVIESSGASYVLWPRIQAQKLRSELVNSGRWHVLYEDRVSTLLVRADNSLPRPLLSSPDSAYRQLTLATESFEAHQYKEAELHLDQALEYMPYLQMACYLLVETQAATGTKQRAAQTLARCQRVFPNQQKQRTYQPLVQ